MKILILVTLFSMSAMAQVKIDKSLLATEQLKRLDQLYKGLDAYCDAQGWHVDLVALCKSAASKKRITDQFSSRIDFLIDKRLDDGREKIEADAIEAECLQKARQQADAISVAYLQGDTCKQVQDKIAAYYASLPVGSGSGSGGQ
jgi:hypothetical protein